MTTFSQVVDEMTLEIVRPDMITMIPGFLNQTIREMHMHAQTNMPVFFDDNRNEALVTVSQADSNDGTFLWDIPNMALLQAIEAINYGYGNRYAKQKSPQVARLNDLSDPNGGYYWYRSGPQIAMAGTGGDGKTVRISWFAYPRSLRYYLPGSTRPLTYNEETMEYAQPQGATISLEEAMNLSTNWLLQRHAEVLKEGIRAKAYKRMDDQFRASTAYSQFQAMRTGMQNAESVEMTASYAR